MEKLEGGKNFRVVGLSLFHGIRRLWLHDRSNDMVMHMLFWNAFGERCPDATLMWCAACSLHWRSFVRRVFRALAKRLFAPTRNTPVPWIDILGDFAWGPLARACLLKDKEF